MLTSPPNERPGATSLDERTVDVGGLQISYDHRVLEPRPWTALQGIWAATLAATLPPGPVLELCSGAGHIGLVAVSRCDRDLIQVDADPVACAFARANAEAAGMADRVDVRCQPLEDVDRHDPPFPLVVADPPYLPTAVTARFPHDPLPAIDGGPDGLDVVHRCLEAIERLLAPDGAALLQLGRSHHVEQLREGSVDLVMTDHKADRWDRHVVLLRRRRELDP